MNKLNERISKLKQRQLAKVVPVLLLAFLAFGCHKAGVQRPANEASPANNTATAVQSYSYQGQQGKTALELLKTKYQVQTKEFSGVGEFVESINGVKPDEKHFWAFYVNGEQAQVGAGQYQTKDTDQIEWKLMEINSTN